MPTLRLTVAPTVVPATTNCMLAALVMLSLSLVPESVADAKSIEVGAVTGAATLNVNFWLSLNSPLAGDEAARTPTLISNEPLKFWGAVTVIKPVVLLTSN